LSKSFLVKSTPQIIEIIESALEIDDCVNRSKLVHQLLLPYILDVVEGDDSEINDVEVARREITDIFHSYYQSI